MARQRNPRGEGSRLREELIEGAQRILEETGSEDAVTLRAVARQVGVTPMSIYDHFPDGRRIVDALVARTFEELTAALRGAFASPGVPLERLVAVSCAYVRFGLEQPERYLTLFERRRSIERARLLAAEGRSFEGTKGAEAFGILADAVALVDDGGRRSAEDKAALLWASLHGYVTLRASSPGFPWFAGEDHICRAFVDGLVVALVDIRR